MSDKFLIFSKYLDQWYVQDKPEKSLPEGCEQFHYVPVSQLEACRKELEQWKARKLRCGECGNQVMTSQHLSYVDDINKLKEKNERLKKRLSGFLHNHPTRDIKPRGECPACDSYHEKQDLKIALEALESMIVEANQHLHMYVKVYKKEPYDTGLMLSLYIKDSKERISRADHTLAKIRGRE